MRSCALLSLLRIVLRQKEIYLPLMTNKVPHFILFSSVTVREKKRIYIGATAKINGLNYEIPLRSQIHRSIAEPQETEATWT